MCEEELRRHRCCFTGHRPISVNIIVTAGDSSDIMRAWKK